LLLGTHVVLFIVARRCAPGLQFKFFGFAARFIPLIQKLNLSVMAVVLLLAIAKIVDVYVIGRIDSAVSRYKPPSSRKAGAGFGARLNCDLDPFSELVYRPSFP